VDTIAGLLHLRERHAFEILAAPPSLAVLDANPIFRALNPDFVTRRAIVPGIRRSEALGIRRHALCRAGQGAALRRAGRAIPASPRRGRRSAWRCRRRRHAALHPRLRGDDAGAARAPRRGRHVLFDGTLFTDDEMIRAGAGPKTGARMGHMP
jgi:pyrroloquinoline quinone biosynthesis protein B